MVFYGPMFEYISNFNQKTQHTYTTDNTHIKKKERNIKGNQTHKQFPLFAKPYQMQQQSKRKNKKKMKKVSVSKKKTANPKKSIQKSFK